MRPKFITESASKLIAERACCCYEIATDAARRMFAGNLIGIELGIANCNYHNAELIISPL